MQRNGLFTDIAIGLIAAAAVVVIGPIVVLGGRFEMLLSDAMRSRDAIWPTFASMPAMSTAALDGYGDDDVDAAVPRAKVVNELVSLGAPELELEDNSRCTLLNIAVSRLPLILLSGMQISKDGATLETCLASHVAVPRKHLDLPVTTGLYTCDYGGNR